MRVFRLFLLIFMFVFSAADVFAKDKGAPPNTGIPLGMEWKKVNGVNMLVPEGTRITKKGSLLMVEGRDEYAVRKLSEMKVRFNQLEAEQKELKEVIKNLTKIIELNKNNMKELTELANKKVLIAE